ncbi:MAG: rhodanese-like domain-containing protein [Campylobacteraceae bacterium]
MKFLHLIVLLFASFLFSSCLANPSVEKSQTNIVDYNYVKQAIGIGTIESIKATLIDTRSHEDFILGTIPTSVNVPYEDMKSFIFSMDNVKKDREIILFSDETSLGKNSIVMMYLKEKGFKNIKFYPMGITEWSSKNYQEIGLPIIENIVKNNEAFLIDTRPYMFYMQGTIPGAISISDTEFTELKGRLPLDKTTQIVVFSMNSCVKTHNVASELMSLGYKNVKKYAGGYPEWMEIHAKPNKTVEQKEVFVKDDVFVDGVKLGSDTGTVDPNWLKALILEDKVPSNILLVDVRDFEEYKTGHLKNAISMDAAKLSSLELAQKLPKDKVIVFTCNLGNRSVETYYRLKKAKIDTSKIFYFNASYTCDKQSNCDVKINQLLGL